jgi:hypothetical protein
MIELVMIWTWTCGTQDRRHYWSQLLEPLSRGKRGDCWLVWDRNLEVRSGSGSVVTHEC